MTINGRFCTLDQVTRVRATYREVHKKASMGDEKEIKFSDEQIQELKQAFALFDVDGSGEVSTDELGTVLATLGQKVSEEELVEIIEEVDED
eukprot:Stramenopile-MAST_4_protein_5941